MFVGDYFAFNPLHRDIIAKNIIRASMILPLLYIFLQADKETDEIYAQMSLQPVNSVSVVSIK